jgi:hypothetical protein
VYAVVVGAHHSHRVRTVASTSTVDVTARLRFLRRAEVSSFTLILGTPDAQPGVGQDVASMPGAAANPADQVASASAARPISSDTELVLRARGVGPGTYPLFATLTYSTSKVCNGVQDTNTQDMGRIARIRVSHEKSSTGRVIAIDPSLAMTFAHPN